MLYILDTDHISLLQQRNAIVWVRMRQVAAEDRSVTVISAAEQIQGRMAVISQAKHEVDAARGFERLAETIRFYQTVQVLLVYQLSIGPCLEPDRGYTLLWQDL